MYSFFLFPQVSVKMNDLRIPFPRSCLKDFSLLFCFRFLGLIGIIGNILTVIVLGKISLNNVFNQLIVTLCCFDTLFNVFSIVEYSLKKGFGLITYETPIYVNLWPKFIYPLQNITYSASLFITLAIAIER